MILALIAAVAAWLGLKGIKRVRSRKRLPGNPKITQWKRGKRGCWFPFGMDW